MEVFIGIQDVLPVEISRSRSLGEAQCSPILVVGTHLVGMRVLLSSSPTRATHSRKK